MGIKTKGAELLSILALNIILIYVFMWVGFQFFPQLFKYDVRDFYSEKKESEPFCNSSVQCSMLFWSKGFFKDGISKLTNKISFRNWPGQHVGIFFYNFISFVLINTLLNKLYTGSLVEAFRNARVKNKAIAEDKENKCFICDLHRDKATEKHINFFQHNNIEHNPTDYIEFIDYLCCKDFNEFTINEMIIYDALIDNDIYWVPCVNKDVMN